MSKNAVRILSAVVISVLFFASCANPPEEAVTIKNISLIVMHDSVSVTLYIQNPNLPTGIIPVDLWNFDYRYNKLPGLTTVTAPIVIFEDVPAEQAVWVRYSLSKRGNLPMLMEIHVHSISEISHSVK